MIERNNNPVNTSEKLHQALRTLAEQKIGILIDDYATPSRAAFVLPSSTASPELVNFIISNTGALFMVAMPSARVASFMLNRMARPATTQSALHESISSIDMTVSVEARAGVTTGISAKDRSVTLKILGEELPQPKKLVSPGHIFPVQCKEGGVLVKPAIPEGALDIVVRAGFTESACFVDILNSTGAFATDDEIQQLTSKNSLPVFKLSELTQVLLQEQKLIERISEARLPTELAGEVKAVVYQSSIHAGEHVALVKGDLSGDEPILTRVQNESTFFDVFGGTDGGSRRQLHQALSLIGKRGRGVLVYLRKREGQLEEQIAHPHETRAHASMQLMREYGVGAQILRDLGATRIELLTNSKKNLIGLSTFGIEIVKQLHLSERV